MIWKDVLKHEKKKIFFGNPASIQMGLYMGRLKGVIRSKYSSGALKGIIMKADKELISFMGTDLDYFIENGKEAYAEIQSSLNEYEDEIRVFIEKYTKYTNLCYKHSYSVRTRGWHHII